MALHATKTEKNQKFGQIRTSINNALSIIFLVNMVSLPSYDSAFWTTVVGLLQVVAIAIGGLTGFFVYRKTENDKKIREYHKQIIVKVYEGWLKTQVSPSRSLPRSPDSRYFYGYIDLTLGVTETPNERIGGTGLLAGSLSQMDQWIWLDAIKHLKEIDGGEWGNDATRCRNELMDDITEILQIGWLWDSKSFGL